MTKLKLVLSLTALAATATLLQADTWSKRTKVTFSGPVQVPWPHTQAGVVTLSAGTYIFRLQDSSSNRHIVEITNTRGDHVYATILSVNDYRLNATSKTVMYFTERKSGTPQAVKAWFYPGDNYGQRFVYPKVQATQIAAAVNQPVPSHEVAVTPAAKVDEVPLHIETPAKAETEYTPTTFEKIDATDTAGVDGEAVKEAPATKQMPKTASPLPSIAAMGLLLMAAGLLLRRASLALTWK